MNLGSPLPGGGLVGLGLVERRRHQVHEPRRDRACHGAPRCIDHQPARLHVRMMPRAAALVPHNAPRGGARLGPPVHPQLRPGRPGGDAGRAGDRVGRRAVRIGPGRVPAGPSRSTCRRRCSTRSRSAGTSRALLARNTHTGEVLSFLGGGVYGGYVPAVVDEITRRAEFVTAYGGGPYGDPGKYQAIFEFQSLIGELVGMEAVSAPTYDGITATTSALLMATRMTGRRRLLVPETANPQLRAHLATFAKPWATIDDAAARRDRAGRPSSRRPDAAGGRRAPRDALVPRLRGGASVRDRGRGARARARWWSSRSTRRPWGSSPRPPSTAPTS